MLLAALTDAMINGPICISDFSGSEWGHEGQIETESQPLGQAFVRKPEKRGHWKTGLRPPLLLSLLLTPSCPKVIFESLK